MTNPQLFDKDNCR